MLLSDFDYKLPAELIATEPSKERDQSRLLVLNKNSGKIEHKIFSDIIEYLNPGDLLVLNNSKVIPARLIGYKESGGEIEIFLSKKLGDSWECLVKGNVRIGAKVIISDQLEARLIEAQANSTWLVSFNLSDSAFFAEIERVGHVPLPPYIIKQRADSLTMTDDKQEYQTVYADDTKKGSVAAPTAGLHFTPELLNKIKAKSIGIEYVTLHVGLGTFLPVKVENIEEHQIHSEWAEVTAQTLLAIQETKKNNKKVVAVGTTSARTLEYFADEISNIQYSMSNQIQNQKSKGSFDIGNLDFDIPRLSAWVDIFIYPPYQFKVVDALITNFHLPKSTLLMLVSALADCPEQGRGGKDNIDKAYQEAIKEKYRFYSYGDAMLIS